MSFVIMADAQFIYNDFDDNQNVDLYGYPYLPVIVTNPDVSGINTSLYVAGWDRSGADWPFVCFLLDGYIDFTTDGIFQFKLYAPKVCNVLFKVEDKHNTSTHTEVETSSTSPNQWEMLTFNFAGAASGTYDMLVIFIDFGVSDDTTFYLDEVVGPGFQGPINWDPVILPVTFEDNDVG